MGWTTGELISNDITLRSSAGADTALLDEVVRQERQYRLQDLAAEAWTHAPYWWKLGDGTVSCSINDGFGSVPSDFASESKQMLAYVSGQRLPIRYAAPDVLLALIQEEGRTGTIPEMWTLHTRTSVGVPRIYIYPTNSAALTLALKNYNKRRPDMVDFPIIAPTVAAGSATGITGTYTYKVTFKTSAGETEAGTASDPVTVSNQKVALSDIPISPLRAVTDRGIYRPINGGTDYKLVSYVGDNTTTTYTDSTADGSLGAAAPTSATAVTGMEQFPEDFQEQLFARALEQLSAGTFSRDDYIRTVKNMWQEHKQGQSVPQVMPHYGQAALAGGGTWWRYLVR